MAKKVKNQRKHQLKYSQPVAVTIDREVAIKPVRTGVIEVERDFGYVAKDIFRLSTIAGSLLVLETGLWYILNHTAAGGSIYNLIKL